MQGFDTGWGFDLQRRVMRRDAAKAAVDKNRDTGGSGIYFNPAAEGRAAGRRMHIASLNAARGLAGAFSGGG